MKLRTVLLMISLLGLATGHLLAQEVTIPNLDFSQGKQGWSAWTGTVEAPWEIEPAGGYQGKPALLIAPQDAGQQVMVMTSTTAFKPGQRYRIQACWNLREVSTSPRADLRVIFRDANERWLTGDDLFAYRTEVHGDWVLKHYRLMPPDKTASANLGIWVRETTGQIRVSGLEVDLLPPGQINYDSMYDYDPNQVELGMKPLKAYYGLREANSPFIPRAKRWNELMMEVADWQEDYSRARRVAHYAGQGEAKLTPHQQALNTALAALDELQKTYGRLYVAKDEAGLSSRFDPAANQLAAAVKTGRAGLLKQLAGLRPPLAGRWLAIPRAPVNQPWWDASKGQPRYMLWVRWSDTAFRDLEEPLRMGNAHTLTAGVPASFEKGVASWQNYLDQQARQVAAGYKRHALITHYSLHDKGYLAPEVARQHNDDPDLRMWDAEGKPMGPASGTIYLNWLNPLARAHMVDVLTQMAKFFKDRTEHQFYIDAWESAGPYAQNVRIGHNPTHRTDFQRYLRQRYGQISDLNQLWGSNFAGFEDLAPLPESNHPLGQSVSAHYLESQRWSQETYIDYLQLIRDTIHQQDPTKPVITQHSGLLSRIFSPRVFEPADILGHHNRAATTMPVQLWMSSLQRYTKKPTALYENFWGCQEDHPQRLPDEKAMRAQMRRYMYRHAVWGRCMQTWWYAYTSAPYLLTYNGNWFNPVYDLTTFRYSAAGFPVEKVKVDKLEAMLLGSEIVRSRVLLLQPYASMLSQRLGGETFREWLAWHELLFPRNQLYEALPDTWVAEGKVQLSDYEVVILPVAPYLERGVSEKLIAFIQAGGVCISSGAPGLFDDQARPDGSLLKAAGLQAEQVNPTGAPWAYRFTPGPAEADRVEATLGKGKLVLISRALSRLEDREPLAALVRRHSMPVAEAPGTTLELLLRRLPDGRHLLCVLNRDPDTVATGRIWLQGRFNAIADVDLPQPVAVPHRVQQGRTVFSTTVDPGSTAYYLLSSG